MRDENPIRTFGDYSKPSHEGYRNTIELSVGNNVVPLRSDTIRLGQNGCSFHEVRSKDPNQHLKDFLKLVDSLNIDGENRERTRLRLFQFSLRDQASNWLERLPAGSITTWEDLTTRFLAQFFPPGRTAKLRNGDFAKPVKAIALPLDVPSASDRRLIKLENLVQCLLEAHLAPTQPTQVNKITTSYEICAGPHDTQYCMEDLVQAFVEYASSRTDKAGADFKQQQNEMTNKIDTVLKAITDRIAGALPSDMVKNPKLSTSLVLMEIKTQQPEEPEPTLKDEFHDLHLNLLVLEFLDHAPIYIAILDKYVESLELGKNGSTFVQGEVPAKIKEPGLFTLPRRLGDSKPFDTLADLGSYVNIIPLYLFKKLNVGLLEETDHMFGLAAGTKSYPNHVTPLLVGRGFLATANAVIDCRMAKIAVEEGITRDVELNPFKDTLVFRRMVEFLGAIPINLKSNMWESKDLIKNLINWDKPPKDEDGAWHAKIRLIDPDEEEFTKTLQKFLIKNEEEIFTVLETASGLFLTITWISFGGNTRDLGSFGEETDEVTDVHQDSPRSIVLKAWRRRRKHKATPS
nr:MAK10-like protein [Tanacetum cinerariifolium]